LIGFLTFWQWHFIYRDKIPAMMMNGAFQVIVFIVMFSVSIWYLGPRTNFTYSNFPCEEMMSAINENSFTSMPDCGT
jgi:hypothetical protein